MAREGIGPLHLMLLRALSVGHTVPTDTLRRVANQHSAGETLMSVLNKMEHRGWVWRNQRGWVISDSGKRVLDPSKAYLPPMSAYCSPPTPPRREGSDYTVYPSRYGDELKEHRGAR